MGFAVTGIDISQTAVAYAQAQCPGAQFQVAMLEEKLPFADEAFAAIWCTEVVEHLFDVHAALAELNRVLRPGGKLILTTPHHGLLKNLVIATIGFDKHYNPYLSHIRFFTRRSLSVCLEHAGFAVDQWRGIGRRWPVWKSQFVVSRKLGLPGPAPEIVG
jgi:SAM-dependent methyltransferase